MRTGTAVSKIVCHNNQSKFSTGIETKSMETDSGHHYTIRNIHWLDSVAYCIESNMCTEQVLKSFFFLSQKRVDMPTKKGKYF